MRVFLCVFGVIPLICTKAINFVPRNANPGCYFVEMLNTILSGGENFVGALNLWKRRNVSLATKFSQRFSPPRKTSRRSPGREPLSLGHVNSLIHHPQKRSQNCQKFTSHVFLAKEKGQHWSDCTTFSTFSTLQFLSPLGWGTKTEQLQIQNTRIEKKCGKKFPKVRLVTVWFFFIRLDQFTK